MLLLLAISFQSGFPTGVENMGGGGSSKFDGGDGGRGRLKSKHGGGREWGNLKYC